MRGVLFALAGALYLGTPPAATVAREDPLVPGQRAEHDLAPGSVRAHTLGLEAGQFLLLHVDQQGTDLAVALVAPDGARTEVDASAGYGREPLSVLARTGGIQRIEVRGKGTGVPARYAVVSGHPRTAAGEDRVRLDAERALSEGAQLARTGTPASAEAALQKFGVALEGWRALEDQTWEAQTLLERAAARPALGRYQESRDDAAAALPLLRRLGDRRGEGRALLLIGESYDYQGELDPAIASYEQALELQRALGDRADEAHTLGRLGWAHGERGERRKHVEMALLVLDLRRQLRDPMMEGWALITLGAAQGAMGAHQDTVESWREARAIFRAAGARTDEGLALQRLGSLYARFGDHEKSAATTEEALAIFRVDQHTDGEITALLTMGAAYSALNDPGQARDRYREALRIVRERGEPSREAYALARIGSAEIALGHYESSRRYLEEAMRLASERKDTITQADALLGLAEIQLEEGQAEQARASFQRVAEMSRLPANDPRRVKAIHHLGRIANDQGDLATARTHAEAVMGMVEAVRGRLTSPALRSSLVASRGAYELYVDVLMGLHRRQPGQGFDEQALLAAEMARAHSLLDELADGGARIREGVDPSLLEEERAIGDRLSAALDRQQRLSQAPHTDEQARAARNVQLLTADWDAVRASIKKKSPRFAELRDPVPATAARIRQDVLDDDTVLLEYALGDKRSFLWVMSRHGLAAYELPARADIDRAAREAYARLNEPAPAAAHSAADALARLSRMVLGPAASSLTAKRLLIVPDGALHYVPFAALPDPDGRGRPLIARHEIVNTPSATVVEHLRRAAAGRRPAPRAVAVLADPVFDRQDERVNGGPAARPASSSADDALASALRSAGMAAGLPRLPFTRREAEAILSLVPARQRKAALDFEASRATVSDPSLADYRYVHFATHGFLNSAQPELSGIVLSLVGRDGADTRGFLTPTDVFNLRLNADMVVLSGCRTALGKELRGEGLVGLSRGFMYAGAPRVVASLWRVDDAATAELMKRFYAGILKRRLAPGAALRAAQLDLMRRPRYRDPFYWAAFQLQGEWR